MHTAGPLFCQVRRALWAAFLLGGCAALLQLALPLYVLHALAEGVAPADRALRLIVLTLIAAAAVATRLLVLAARDRILVRAGLWLDHTLSQQVLENGASLSVACAQEQADALARLRHALVARALIPALDAPWLGVLLLVLLGLLHPLLAAVAGVHALALALVAWALSAPEARLAQQARAQAACAASWRQAAGAERREPALFLAAVRQWERMSRAQIAEAYPLQRREATLSNIAELARATAPLSLIGGGAWLLLDGLLTPAALLAALLIMLSLLLPLEGLIESLRAASGALAAYRHLSAPATDAALLPETFAPTPPSHPRLLVRGPLAFALGAIVLFVAAAGALGAMRLSDLERMTGSLPFAGKRAVVRIASPGIVSRLFVREGSRVHAGDLLILLDTSALDGQILQLKAQAEAAARELRSLNQEAMAMVAARDPSAADRSRLAELERRIGQLEEEALDLNARIGLAERNLAGSEIRAPVSGRVVALSLSGPNAPIAAGAALMEIASSDQALIDCLLEPILHNTNRAEQVRPLEPLRRAPWRQAGRAPARSAATLD
jgi:biotin carboxyl carrier protein